MTDTLMTNDLAHRIREKRGQLDAFLARAKPRKMRLVNTTIVAGIAATALTAAPAAGGATFTGWLTQTFGLAAPAWQLLCAGASLCSITATAATQVLKSQNIEEQVTRALSCRAKLEVIEIGLATGSLDVPHATTEFIRCVEETAFV